MTNPWDRSFHRDKKTSHFAHSDKHPAQHINSSHAKSREKSGTPLILHVGMDRARDFGETGPNILKAASKLGPDPNHVIADRCFFG